MSKKAPSPASAPSAPWSTIILAGMIGTLIGATITFFVMRPKTPTAPTAMVMPAGTTNPDPTQHLPAPSLTTGQTPAQADRTLGNFYYDHQNWPKAIEHYQSAIRQGSDDADIRTDLGNAYRFAGRPDDALAQYGFARKMNPNHEFSLFNQGGLYMEDLKQPAKAVEIWQEYLVRFPNGTNAQAARQLIAQALGTATDTLPSASNPAGQPTVNSGTEDLILRQIQSGKTKPTTP
jgi:predicted Zn-dependent protease